MRSLQYNFSLKALLWVCVVFVQVREHKGCLEKERIGLLQLKSFLIMTIPYTYSDHLLTSWVEDASKSDCCGWERIACNSTTGHVIELSLDNLGLSLGNPNYHTPQTFAKVWSLNISLLEPFKELRSLDLSLNAINGWIVDEGFERLVVLKNLKTLILDDNYFDDSILPSLSRLTSLATLSLASNWDLGRRGNDEGWKSLSSLENLEILDLSFCSLNKSSSLQSLTAIKSLKNLNLAGNDLTGSLPISDLANFIKLEILDISGNGFTGSVSPFIWKLFSLKALSMSSNKLNGTLPTRGQQQEESAQ